MRKKIAISLFAVFLLFTIGISIAVLNVSRTTSELNRLIGLHEVEQLRRSLVINLQTVQSDLYTVHTSLGHNVNSIINNVSELESSVQECSGCHHTSQVQSNISEIQSTIIDYENAISYYITGSADKKRIESMKLDAARIGTNLLTMTSEMSHNASLHLEQLTSETLSKVEAIKVILSITLFIAFLIAVYISYNLARSITNPIDKLLQATRKIKLGEYGHTVTINDRTEFSELADNFNKMSIAIKDSYKEINKEIDRSLTAEAALRVSKERYQLAARGANDGLWDWDLRVNTIFYSQRWKSILGFEDSEILDSPEEWFGRVHPDDRPQVESDIAANVKGLTQQFRCEYRMLNKNGTYLWMLSRGVAVKDDDGKAYRIAGSQTDITKRKVAEEQLMYDAFHDTLTGLPNRALFMDRLEHANKRAGRLDGYMFAVLFIDVDRFKVINDSLGHSVGDQMLVAISERLDECLRPGETIARLGGDEFSILLEDIKDRSDVIHIINRMQKKLELPFNLNDNEVFATVSMGVSFSSSEYSMPDHLLRDADIAMYQAKVNGRSRYEIFNKGMHSDVVARLKLETEMRRAIENNEFILYYQPIMKTSSGRPIGFEALVRWQHPERGLLSPLEFIPSAEETGMINVLGEWILNEACSQIAKWQQQYPAILPLSISVNISTKQFTPALILQVKDIMDKTGIIKGSLILEITESMIMDNAQEAAELLLELKKVGVLLHIDDFGTGYSSLSYLHQFPLDALKIDRSFIVNMVKDDENMEIVKTITNLANNLNLDVIAEGVETDHQLAQLRQIECNNFQGFLVSRPMSIENTILFLNEETEKRSSI